MKHRQSMLLIALMIGALAFLGSNLLADESRLSATSSTHTTIGERAKATRDFAPFVRSLGATRREHLRVSATFNSIYEGPSSSRAARATTPAANPPASTSPNRYLPLANGMLGAVEQVLASMTVASSAYNSGNAEGRTYELYGQMALAGADALSFVASDSVDDIPLPATLRKFCLATADKLQAAGTRFDEQPGDAAAWQTRTASMVQEFKAIAQEIASTRAKLFPATAAGTNDGAFRAAGVFIVAQSLLSGMEAKGSADVPGWQRVLETLAVVDRAAIALLKPVLDASDNGLSAEAKTKLTAIVTTLQTAGAAAIPTFATTKEAKAAVTVAMKALDKTSDEVNEVLESLQDVIFP